MKKPNHLAGLENAFDAIAQEPAASEVAGGATSGIACIPPSTDKMSDVCEPISSFDYGAFSPEDEIFLKQSEAMIKKTLKATVFDVGLRLIEVRDRMRRRGDTWDETWSDWLKNAIDISKSSAHNYIAAAEWSMECPTVGRIPLKTLYSAATASEEVKAQILQLLKDEEEVNLAVVRALKHADKAATTNLGGGEVAIGEASASAAKDMTTLHVRDIAGDGETSDIEDEMQPPVTTTRLNEPDGALEADTPISSLARTFNDDAPSGGNLEEVGPAIELIARLRDAFEDDVIRELLDLWQRTTPRALSDVMDRTV